MQPLHPSRRYRPHITTFACIVVAVMITWRAIGKEITIPSRPRRYWLETLCGTLALAAAWDQRTPRKKATREAAGYVPRPFRNGASCAICANHLAAGTACRRVRGTVAPGGFCNFFTPRRATT